MPRCLVDEVAEDEGGESGGEYSGSLGTDGGARGRARSGGGGVGSRHQRRGHGDSDHGGGEELSSFHIVNED